MKEVLLFFFYYLIEGELSVYNFTPEGKEFLQHKVKEKHFFGEPAVLLKKPFPGNVEVTSEFAEILKIKRENFLQYLVAIRPIFNINILNAIDNIIEIRTNTK